MASHCFRSDIQYGQCLTGLYHPIDHHITSNYTPDMLSCYSGFWILEPRACTMLFISGAVVVVQGHASIYECNMRYGSHMTVVDHPIDHGMTSNYTQDILSRDLGYRKNQEFEPWTSSVV
jgi:hypothetical protein